MPSESDRDRLRSDIGANVTSLPNTEADAIFAEAAELYTDATSITAYARILAIRRLLASAAKLTDYTQNASQEKQSQVFSHLKDLLAFWRGELDTAVTDASTTSAARFGGQRRKPKRVKEWPGGY